MLKEDLKQKWSVYCDTDKLVDDVMTLLTKYGHPNTEHGVCSMLDTYFTNKRSLIDLIKNSKHYLGDMRIAFDVEIESSLDSSGLNAFCSTFYGNIEARSKVVKRVDEHGKSRGDYVKVGVNHISAMDLLNEEIRQKLNSISEGYESFNSNGELLSSIATSDRLGRMFYYTFANEREPALSNRAVEFARELPKPVSLTEGMKTSRAFNKVCHEYELDTLPKYNKLFAEYADMVSGHKRKLKFFISVNPLDYLTMSFGVSWSSCHNIDRGNKRKVTCSVSSQYCSGTMSYMLDSTSIVTYVHKEMPTSFEDGKIYRQMFHFGDNMLVQSRLYPQGNDGCTDLYKTFLKFMHNEFSDLLGLTENKWVVREDGVSGFVSSRGTHYKDYLYHDSCNVSYPAEKEFDHPYIIIGHYRVCPDCGKTVIHTYNKGDLGCCR